MLYLINSGRHKGQLGKEMPVGALSTAEVRLKVHGVNSYTWFNRKEVIAYERSVFRGREVAIVMGHLKGKRGVVSDIAGDMTTVILDGSHVEVKCAFGELNFGDNTTNDWNVGDFGAFQIDGRTVTGQVSYVGNNYLKLRINEGDFSAGREVVRVPVDVSRQVIQEKTQYQLFFKKGSPNFRSDANQYFDTESEMLKFLEENIQSLNITDIRYRKVVTRTSPMKTIKAKISFEI